jgi:plastocyanin
VCRPYYLRRADAGTATRFGMGPRTDPKGANMRRSTMSLLAGLLALSVLAAACGSSSDAGSSSPSSATSSSAPAPSPTASETTSPSASEGGQITIGGDTANDHGTKDATGMSELPVELDDFYFEPTVITGDPGQSIKLELENEGQALHNFTLTDQQIDQDVAAGQSSNVTVTIPQSGEVQFFCKYHKSLGMVGGLSTP